MIILLLVLAGLLGVSIEQSLNRTRGINLKIGSKLEVNSLSNGSYSVAISEQGLTLNYSEDTEQVPNIALKLANGSVISYQSSDSKPFTIPASLRESEEHSTFQVDPEERRRQLQTTSASSESRPTLAGLEPSDTQTALREALLANLTQANLTREEAEYIVDQLNSTISLTLEIRSNSLIMTTSWMLAEPTLATSNVSPVIDSLLELLGSNNGTLTVDDITKVIEEHKTTGELVTVEVVPTNETEPEANSSSSSESGASNSSTASNTSMDETTEDPQPVEPLSNQSTETGGTSPSDNSSTPPEPEDPVEVVSSENSTAMIPSPPDDATSETSSEPNTSSPANETESASSTDPASDPASPDSPSSNSTSNSSNSASEAVSNSSATSGSADNTTANPSPDPPESASNETSSEEGDTQDPSEPSPEKPPPDETTTAPTAPGEPATNSSSSEPPPEEDGPSNSTEGSTTDAPDTGPDSDENSTSGTSSSNNSASEQDQPANSSSTELAVNATIHDTSPTPSSNSSNSTGDDDETSPPTPQPPQETPSPTPDTSPDEPSNSTSPAEPLPPNSTAEIRELQNESGSSPTPIVTTEEPSPSTPGDTSSATEDQDGAHWESRLLSLPYFLKFKSQNYETMMEAPFFNLAIDSIRKQIDCGGTNDGQLEPLVEFDYKQNGEDWPLKWPSCGLEQQSPINLLDPETQYGYSYHIYQFKDDENLPEYWDLKDTVLTYDPKLASFRALIDHTNGYNGFASELGEKLFNAPTKWDGLEFQFHMGSEHTINSKRYDLELQVYHTEHIRKVGRVLQEEAAAADPQDSSSSISAASEASSDNDDEVEEPTGSFERAAISILFSADQPSEGIDSEVNELFSQFFADLRLDEENAKAPSVTFGKLMSKIDWSQRWVYKGSQTVPPCRQFVYWNVLRTVYPIDPLVLDQFRKKLSQSEIDTDNKQGNWRAIQKGVNEQIYYVESGARAATAVSVVLAAVLAGLF